MNKGFRPVGIRTETHADTSPPVIALASTGRVDPDAMVTARYPLERAAQALESDRRPGNLKTIVEVAELWS